MKRTRKTAIVCDNECPNCESEAIEGGAVTIDSPHALQELTCCVCNATWTAVYRLTGYR